jgi:hypothetical protein
VSENRVFKKKFGPKREKVTGCWRKSLTGEFHNLNCSLNIVMMIRSRRMKLEKILTLKRILKKQDVKMWSEFMWLRVRTNSGSGYGPIAALLRDYASSGSTTCG